MKNELPYEKTGNAIKGYVESVIAKSETGTNKCVFFKDPLAPPSIFKLLVGRGKG